MAELTHDTAEDGFHEIQLSGKQLVFLFMATTVVLVVTFLCGILVGRGVRSERDAQQAIDSPIAEPPAAAAPTTDPASGAPPAGTEAAAPVDLTYHNDLQKSGTTAELKKPTPESAQRPPSKPEPVAPQEPAPAATAKVPTSGLPGSWYLQLSALRNRAVAAKTVETLRGKGYPAYLENPAAGVPIYRVRVGRYRERAEAERAAQRLLKEEQFPSLISRN